MNNVRVASINIYSIRFIESHRGLLLQFCLEYKVDLVGLQEVTFHECADLRTQIQCFE